MKKYFLYVLLLISSLFFGQVQAIVINSQTKEIIPFVNIWVENEDIGTTSNEKGQFYLDVDSTKTIVFSAIGFENLKVNSSQIIDVVALKPTITELPEITIVAQKKAKELSIGKFRKSKIHYYFACAKPWIVARYFKYKPAYDKTKFLKKIKILTKSKLNNAKFNIRLYTVNDKGEPEGYIYDKNIIGIAKKGKRITEIDISNLNIEFPKNGFFVAIEWLIIDANKYEFTYTMQGSKHKHKEINYAPEIGIIPSKTDNNSWIYNTGKWQKVWKNNGFVRSYKGKYNTTAIELILSNKHYGKK